MKLTDLGIRGLQPPERGAQIYYDDAVPGFGVRVSEGGTKSFVLTHGARRHRETTLHTRATSALHQPHSWGWFFMA